MAKSCFYTYFGVSRRKQEGRDNEEKKSLQKWNIIHLTLLILLFFLRHFNATHGALFFMLTEKQGKRT